MPRAARSLASEPLCMRSVSAKGRYRIDSRRAPRQHIVRAHRHEDARRDGDEHPRIKGAHFVQGGAHEARGPEGYRHADDGPDTWHDGRSIARSTQTVLQWKELRRRRFFLGVRCARDGGGAEAPRLCIAARCSASHTRRAAHRTTSICGEMPRGFGSSEAMPATSPGPVLRRSCSIET